MSNLAYGLDGRVFVITGGSRGIGFEIAKLLIGQNARVVICGRKTEGLDAAKIKLDGGNNLLTVQAHVAKEADVENLFNKALECFGKVDGLINNMGMNL